MNGLMQTEVARLIRTGVTALFEKGSGLDYTDHELDVLLGEYQTSGVKMKRCCHQRIKSVNLLVWYHVGREVQAPDSCPPGPPITGSSVSESLKVDEEEEKEDEETAVRAFWQERGEIDLEEVDMHQLDGVTYTKGGNAVKPEGNGKRRRGTEVNLDDLIFTKRQRRERVIKVDGKGTGYGGSVPVLAEQLHEDEEASRVVVSLSDL